jgi:ubiquinone/menaquinone biosynthesis C-methylase UbiE
LRRLNGRADITRLVGVDLVEPTRIDEMPNAEYIHGSIEKLPFADGEFDTVVCTHTLEHIPDVHGALAELRRVASKQLVIVVPKERPYRWGFNLHIHFFPYRYNVDALTGAVPGATLRDLDDWYYVEPIS